MTDLFPASVGPASSRPSPVDRFFRSSGSGRDSPRTLVAEEIIKLHIGAPPNYQTENKPFKLNTLKANSRKRPSVPENLSDSEEPTFPQTSESSSETSPTKRGPPPPMTPVAPDEMDICGDSTAKLSRAHSPSPPLLDASSDDDDDDMHDIRPPDERTRYLRSKKRAQQIVAYRMRELKADRDLRCLRRNNSLSPKASKVITQIVKKVKFEL